MRKRRFPKEFSDIIGSAFEIRSDTDYEDFYIVSKIEAEQQTEDAKIFLDAVENYRAPLKTHN